VKSIGAGGGSIAWVDSGGLLRVGPKSAGSTPGPVAYGKGGTEPTVTDCSLILGHIDADFFLGGAMALDRAAAVAALEEQVAAKLGLSVEEAAAAVLALASEKMVGAIDEITVNQGIDPSSAVLIGGGGAAGLNAVAVGRRLGCAGVLIPEAGAVLSAAGALMSELSSDYARMLFMPSQRFDEAAVNDVLAELESRCRAFADGPGEGALETMIEFSVEARYPHQIWEIEVPLEGSRIAGAEALQALKSAFHDTHKAIFEISDPRSEVEFVTWRAKVRCRLREGDAGRVPSVDNGAEIATHRQVYLAGSGWVDAKVARFEAMRTGEPLPGPAIIESSFTTVVVDPGTLAVRTDGGGLKVTF
jgi:N-methylhydantoinase A